MDDAELEKVLNDVLYLFRFTQGTIMRARVSVCSEIESVSRADSNRQGHL